MTSTDSKAAGAAALIAPSLIAVYLLVTSTLFLTDQYWPYDIKRVFQLAILPVLFGLFLIHPRLRDAWSRQIRRWPPALWWLLAGIFSSALVSATVHAESGMHAAYSITGVVQPALVIVCIPAIAACRQLAGQSFDCVVLALLALGALAVGIQELFGWMATLQSGSEFNFNLALLHFSWPRFYNQLQAWFIPVFVALPLLFRRSALVPLACGAILALQWYIVLMTGARGAFVSILAAIVISAALLPASRRLLIKWQLLGLLAGGAIYAMVYWSYLPEPANTSPITARDDGSAQTVAAEPITDSTGKEGFHDKALGRPMANTSGRLRLWRDSLHDSAAHPWLGEGPMNYACRGKIRRPAHPHSLPLQLVGEWGIPATAGVALLSLYLAWTVLRFLRSTGTQISCLVATGVLAAALYSSLSAVHFTPASQTAGILMLGWLLGCMPLPTTSCSPQPTARKLLGAALLMSLALFLGASMELKQLEFREMNHRALAQKELLYPRFWQFGKVCRQFTNPPVESRLDHGS